MLDDTRINLVVVGQPLPPEGLPEIGELLRPDGHVGLSGLRLDPGAVSRYLSERLQIRF